MCLLSVDCNDSGAFKVKSIEKKNDLLPISSSKHYCFADKYESKHVDFACAQFSSGANACCAPWMEI